MRYKKLLILNIINLIMLCLILYMNKIFSFAIIIQLIIAWFIFVCVSNYILINNDKINRKSKLNQAEKGLFANEVRRAEQSMQSIEARAQFFEDSEDDNLKEVYLKLKEQVNQNVDFIMKYIETYDYVTRPASQRNQITKLVAENEMLVSKLNSLVEHVITMRQSANDDDTSYIDDLIGALQQVSEGDLLENKYK